MGSVQVLTKDRMLAIEAASVVSGLVDVNGRLILTKKDNSTIDAGNVKGPTGASPVYPVGPFVGGARYYSRLAVLDGISAFSGADIEFIISGLGDYGTAKRASVLVHVAQRGSGVCTVRAWGYGMDDSTLPITLYIRPMGPYLFEVWGYFPTYTLNMGLTVLASSRTTINIDSASVTAPSGLVAQTIDKVMTNVDTQAALLAGAMPIEKTKLTATVLDPNTLGWFVKGADGVTYGPLTYSSSWLPTPGDEVWVTKNGDGSYSIGGAKSKTNFLAMPITSITYGRGWGDSNWEDPTYTLRNGIVQLNGMVATSNATAFSTVLITLPPEARPDTDMIFAVDRGGAVGALYILANGNVTFEPGVVVNSYISLSSIAYPAAGRATWTTIPAAYFSNGWVDYYSAGTPSYGTARYWVDEYGYVWYAGLIKAGTMSLPAITFPANHPVLSDKSGHVLTAASGNVGYLYIPNVASRQISVGATGTNTWVTLANLAYPSVALIASTAWFTGNPSGGTSGGRDSIAMLSSWTPYDGAETSWTKFRIGQRPDGLVMTRGLIAAGTFGSQSILCILRDEWTRKRSNIIPTIANAAYGRVDIQGNTYSAAVKPSTITLNSGSNLWFSMDGIKWFPD